MGGESTTEVGIKTKGGKYVHPDYPDRDIETLRKDASAFDIDAHLISLLFSEPFYADIIRSLTKVMTDSVPTAGVIAREDTLRMYWNPLFLAAYPSEMVKGILMHEALHLALEHTTTRRYEPHMAWNWATDLAINSNLSKDQCPPCGLKPGRALKAPPDLESASEEYKRLFLKMSTLIESLPSHLSSEEYFGILMDNQDFQDMMGMNGEGLGSMDDHGGWDELSDEDREYISSKVRQVVKEAQERADSNNRWGSVSAELREEIRKRVHGEIDWRAVLKQFVGNTTRSNRTSSVLRANRKYPGIHAGHSRDYTPSIGIFLDQSGSVSDEALELFFGELYSLSTRAEFTVYNFDTKVDIESKQVWRRGNNPKLVRTRCGGTDFTCIDEYLKESREKFEAVIVLTDGGASRPDSARGYRRCWVLEPGTDLAWGEADSRDVVVKLKKNMKSRV